MKFTFLGTAAAEGFPAIFCNCQYCQQARRKGGKNLRTRSQAIIDGTLLIDYPADSYFHALKGEFRFDKVRTLLFTHSHSDHCYPEDLKLHCGGYSHNPEAQTLHVYCGKSVYDKILSNFGKDYVDGVELHVIKAYETFKADEFTITPLPARHEDALIYIVKKDNKQILYANDTGYFFEEVFDYIQKNQLHFDFVSYDCTNVNIPITDEGRHMGLPNIVRVMDRLIGIGAIDEATIQFITHFSHNANPDHDTLEQIAAPLGLKVAYDGLTVKI